MPHTQNFDVIIIGAGIGGLTCGNILAKNGMKVLILEKNPTPGGAVSTFYRNGYPIDISHSLCGVREDAFIRKTFDYLDIYKKLEFIELDKAFVYISRKSGEAIPCYTDLNRYKDELTKHFPSESKNIDNFFSDIIRIWENEVLKSYHSPDIFRLITYPFLFPNLVRFKNYTFDRFLARYTKNESLKELISVSWPFLGLDKHKLSALYAICIIMAYHNEKSYFVKGGFGKIPQTLAANLEKNGGKILYNTRVSKIIINKKGACAVKTDNAFEYHAKKIISNCDSKKTFLDLIDNGQLRGTFLNRIKRFTMSCSAIQVHVVAHAEVGKEYLSSGTIHLDLEESLRKILHLSHHQDYGSAALSINSLNDFSITKTENIYIFNLLWMPADYYLWKKILFKLGRGEYVNIKSQIGDLIVEHLRIKFHIKDVKLINVLTPSSFEEWLNSTDGAIYDVACSPSQVLIDRLNFRTPINNLYMVGAKTFPGHGIAGAMCSAVSLADILTDGKLTKGKFVLN